MNTRPLSDSTSTLAINIGPILFFPKPLLPPLSTSPFGYKNLPIAQTTTMMNTRPLSASISTSAQKVNICIQLLAFNLSLTPHLHFICLATLATHGGIWIHKELGKLRIPLHCA